MGFFSKKSEDVLDKVMEQSARYDKSFLAKWQGEIILLVVLAALGGVGYVVYLIAMDLSKAVNDKMSNNKRFGFNEKGGIDIKVKQRSQEKTLDSAQRFAYKAWLNSKAPDSYDGPLKYREEKRDVSKRNATLGANRGWA